MNDSDERFVINPITRVAKSDSRKVTLLQFDHNSERFTFECPRYIEGHDMTLLQVETGVKYDEAVDVVPCRYTYEETTEPIETADSL